MARRILSQREAVKQFSGRVIALDFDQFLAGVAESMARILGHFGLPIDSRYLSEIGRSPVLTRYSKAPEYDYTPNIRAEVLRDSRHCNSDEIRKGMHWLDSRAHADNAIAQIVSGTNL